MPAEQDIGEGRHGDVSADVLARRLSDAVAARASGNGGSNGSAAAKGDGGANGARDAREVAAEIGAAMLAETSAGTAEHSDDVVLISEAIGERMGISGPAADDLRAAARLHDIGKVWIPTELLEKPGPLLEEEWRLMHQHTVVGERILRSVPELREVARLVRHSHERWDGGGYPDGLAGSEVPLGSRIIFCADAFHAIRCDRPYRAGKSAREAVAEVTRCAGTQFDPQVASTLEQVVRERRERPHGAGGSPRLLALLMCLVLGGGGAALARSGAIPEPAGGSAAHGNGKTTPPACGTAACPTVAGPVGGLSSVGALTGEPAPRPLNPGLPGQLHRQKTTGKVRGKSALAHQLHKGKRGKSAEAKARHAAKANGHSSNGNGVAAGRQTGQSTPAAPSSGSRGGSSSGSRGHLKGGHHGSHRGRGSSHGRSGSRGSSGAARGSSGSRGR